ncbi:MAG TPA: conjugal transfer protein TraF, partial [Rickettsia endosymbiont of Omalisus fontisbellaquei]|nr:conjugal transfer protein TraF [Rickettsia endosymbiont of Omalisus fontisbellaquei]
MKNKIGVLIMLIASNCLAAENKIIRNEKHLGFLWYNEENIEIPENQKDKANSGQIETKNSNIAPYKQRIKDLKEQFDDASLRAIDNPTLENVLMAQRLQKKIINKSEDFGMMWYLASLIDPQLTDDNSATNSLDRKLRQEYLDKKNNRKLHIIAENWGVVLQINTKCTFCEIFAPIVKGFAGKYGFQLIAVSENGKDYQGIKGVKDTGILKG